MRERRLRGWGYFLGSDREGVIFRVGSLGSRMRVAVSEGDILVVSGVGSVDLKAVTPLVSNGRINIFFEERGRVSARFIAVGKNATLILRQCEVALNNPETVARKIVRAAILNKIWASREIFRMFRGESPEPYIEEMVQPLKKLKSADNIDSIRSCEAEASRTYIEYLSAVLGEFGFEKRTRQPPTDPVNATISFGYMRLYEVVRDEIVKAGLDPRVSFLHVPHRRNPTLSFDIAEEFKQPVVDIIVVTAFKMGVLNPDAHFEERGRGTYLNNAGREIFSGMIAERLQITLGGCTLREHIRFQVSGLRDFLLHGTSYRPFIMRRFHM